MTPKEYKRAVRKASRIIAFVKIRADSKRAAGIKISKANALLLVRALPPNAQIVAEWGDPETGILFVG